MGAYDGKAWEDKFKQLVEKAGCDVVRFHDVTLGYKNIDSPCDFVIALESNLPPVLIETKVCQQSSFKVEFRQLDRLLALNKFTSFVVIWFTEYKKILAFDIIEMGKLRDQGVKSINPNKIENYKDIRAIELCSVFYNVNPKELEVQKLWKEKV